MGLRGLVVAGLALAVAQGCGDGAPGDLPGSAAVPESGPSTVDLVRPSPGSGSTNTAPVIRGQDVCISPLNEDHVFDLALEDADGHAIRWTAEKREPQGNLHQTEGGPVPSGTTVTVVYSPPPDRADENWITIVATDSVGASTIKRLYVKNR